MGSILEALLRGGGQGATAGFNDELAARLESALPGSVEYERALAGQRQANKVSEKEHPAAYGFGKIVGSLPQMALTGGQSLLAQMAAGAGLAALTGAGESEGRVSDRLGAAGRSAAAGGLVTGAIGGAGKLLGGFGQKMVRDQVARVATKGGKYTPDHNLVQAATDTILDNGLTGRGALKKIGERIAQLGQSADDVVNQAAERGVQVSHAQAAQAVGRQAQRLQTTEGLDKLGKMVTRRFVGRDTMPISEVNVLRKQANERLKQGASPARVKLALAEGAALKDTIKRNIEASLGPEAAERFVQSVTGNAPNMAARAALTASSKGLGGSVRDAIAPLDAVAQASSGNLGRAAAVMGGADILGRNPATLGKLMHSAGSGVNRAVQVGLPAVAQGLGHGNAGPIAPPDVDAPASAESLLEGLEFEPDTGAGEPDYGGMTKDELLEGLEFEPE